MKFSSTLGLLASIAPAMAVIAFLEPNSQLTYQLYAAASGSNADLHVNMSVPSSTGWGAVGIGSQMSGALMFVLLPDSTNGSTISVRSTTGHNAPTALQGVTFQITNASSANNMLSASGVCRGCQTWSGGSVNLRGTQSFIYAVGSGTGAVSGSGQSARISRHCDSCMGDFTRDMTQAAVAPSADSSSAASGSAGDASAGISSTKIVDKQLILAHAVILPLVFMFFMPLAVILLRAPGIGSWKLHAIANTISLVLVIIGMAIAIHMCLNTRFASFHTPHQGIGLAATAGAIVQWFLGAAHHVGFNKFQSRWAVSYVHLALGPSVMILGAINPILGFLLVEKRSAAIGVGVVSLFIVLAVLSFSWGMQAVSRPKTETSRLASSNDERGLNSRGEK